MAIACSSNTMAILSIFFLLFQFPLLAFSSSPFQTFTIPSGGPESYAFEANGVFYTAVNDGRIVKYAGSDVGFVTFAHASPNRTKEFCESTTDPEKGGICGRTLGVALHHKRGTLILADTYHGLLEVGPEGGLATQLSNTACGTPYKWLDGVDVDQETSKIYFTDVSTIYNYSQIHESVKTGDSTGRFIEYDPETYTSRVLMSGLTGPGGAATSMDGSFVLLSEFVGNKITKYWLTGPKANTPELLMNIPGPANMHRLPSGNYWVAVNNQTSGKNVPTGVKIDKFGKILHIIPFKGIPYDEGTFITEVHENGGKLYIATIYQLHGVIYTLAADQTEPLA